MIRVSKFALALCLAMATMSPEAEAFAVSRSVDRVATAGGTSLAAFLAPSARLSSLLRMASDDEVSGATSTLVRKPESSVEVTITAPGSATQAAYDKACAEASKALNIPGFRKGAKIPPQVIENQMAQTTGGRYALREQAISSLLGQLIEPCLKDEHDLEPIGQPELTVSAAEIAEQFKAGDPIELTVRCDVWPDIDWKDVPGKEKPYYGLEGTYKRKPFNQERFDKALGDLRDRYATTEPMEDGKALEMGNACVVNMEGYMAQEDGKTKGEPLPNAASGDNVEIILGEGRYMTGLVEGLIGAKVGETKEIYVSFPTNLKDKTLAGKKAVFDVEVLEASRRTVPEVTDEFAEEVRPGLTAESLMAELRKAVDEEDAKEFVEERNKALGKALAEVMDVEVPDTLVTNQAREKYAMMMTDFRDQGMSDEDIKKMINPENFLKYKDIEKPDIVRDFKISMATDEIARLEGIEVPSDQVEEQLGSLRKEAGDDEFDEAQIRPKVESTLQRRLVFDFLNEHANLDVEYVDAEDFDAALMEQLAEESLAREKELAAKEAAEAEAEGKDVVAEEVAVEDTSAAEEGKAVADAKAAEEAKVVTAAKMAEEAKGAEDDEEVLSQPVADKGDQAERYGKMDLEEKAFNILLDLGMVEQTPDPDAPDYDSSQDDELAPENVL